MTPAPQFVQCALEAVAVAGAADFVRQFVHRDEVSAVIEQSQNYVGVIHGKSAATFVAGYPARRK